MILQSFPPMGVYETLFKFADATSMYMGDPGTHPWAQGFPLTTQLPGGPSIPQRLDFSSTDLKYPTATGNLDLRKALANYYNTFYAAGISESNIAVFAGGRPGIFAVLMFLLADTTVAVESTEYTPYYDMLRLMERDPHLISSSADNCFRPSANDYNISPAAGDSRVLLIKSNPCNPTGVAVTGAELRALVQAYSQPGRAALFDEAYEFFSESEPESALRYVDDIDATDVFVVGAATKGLQVPGLRVGWVVAAERHIEVFRNYSSIAMGGVSRASQLLVAELLEVERVRQARDAVQTFYASQRNRYAEGLGNLGFELYTGGGGFYHWGKLPHGFTANDFNERLFRHNAAILPGRLCDMARIEGEPSALDHFIRFSFGPLAADSYAGDLDIIGQCINP